MIYRSVLHSGIVLKSGLVVGLFAGRAVVLVVGFFVWPVVGRVAGLVAGLLVVLV